MWRKIIPPPTLPMFNDGSILRNVWKCHRHQHRHTHTHTLARRSPIRGERAPPIAIQRNDVNDVPIVYSNDVILLMPSLFPIFLLSDWTFPLSSTSSSLWLKNKSYIYIPSLISIQSCFQHVTRQFEQQYCLAVFVTELVVIHIVVLGKLIKSENPKEKKKVNS